MLRYSIPFDVWLRQPDGVIETAIRLVNEEAAADNRNTGKDGPQMNG